MLNKCDHWQAHSLHPMAPNRQNLAKPEAHIDIFFIFVKQEEVANPGHISSRILVWLRLETMAQLRKIKPSQRALLLDEIFDIY